MKFSFSRNIPCSTRPTITTPNFKSWLLFPLATSVIIVLYFVTQNTSFSRHPEFKLHTWKSRMKMKPQPAYRASHRIEEHEENEENSSGDGLWSSFVQQNISLDFLKHAAKINDLIGNLEGAVVHIHDDTPLSGTRLTTSGPQTTTTLPPPPPPPPSPPSPSPSPSPPSPSRLDVETPGKTRGWTAEELRKHIASILSGKLVALGNKDTPLLSAPPGSEVSLAARGEHTTPRTTPRTTARTTPRTKPRTTPLSAARTSHPTESTPSLSTTHTTTHREDRDKPVDDDLVWNMTAAPPDYMNFVSHLPRHPANIATLPKLPLLDNFKNPCWFEKFYSKKLDTEKKRLRCAPYFFIAASPKCATTDIFRKLCRHRHVVRCSGYHFWSRIRFAAEEDARLTFGDYLSHLMSPGATNRMWRRKHTMDDGRYYHDGIIGEDSPSLLWSGTRLSQGAKTNHNEPINCPIDTARTLRRMIGPSPKFLLLFRDPVERVWSDYKYFGDYVKSPKSFHRRVVRAIKLWNNNASHERPCHAFNDPPNRAKQVLLSAGLYSLYLSQWLQVFPRSNFLVIKTEDYAEYREETFNNITDFLQLDRFSRKEMDRILRSKRQNSGKDFGFDMMNNTREILREFYAPYNRQLAALLRDTRFLW